MPMTTERTVTLCGRKLDHPGHICAFFDSRNEEYEILVPYFKEGLAQDEQVVNIVDANRHDDHCARLQAHGVDVKAAQENGSLKVLTAEETYIQGGRFGAQ